MFISPQPTIRLRIPSSKGKRPFYQGKRVFTADGTSALVAGLKILGIGEGDSVLIPAYICKAIPSALKPFGIRHIYYPVKQDLTVDTAVLKDLVDSTDSKAIMVVHYFGFIDPCFDDIIKLCRDRGLKVIEDCVQALYSKDKERNAGEIGDIGIFSLHKWLGTPTGGMISINFEHQGPVKLEVMPFAEKILKLLKVCIYIFEKFIGFSARPYLLSLGPVRRFVRRNTGGEIAKAYNIDSRSLKIFEKTDETEIIKKQRENFRYLLAKTQEFNLTPLYRELSEGVSPFGFPVILEERDKIHRKLYRKGFLINALWDNLPEDITEEKFPVSHYLKQRILVLPVHQDIELRHMDALLKAITQELIYVERS